MTIQHSQSPAHDRFERLYTEHHIFLIRFLRRLGLKETDAEDAAQQTFMIIARRLDDIEEDRERAFLCGTARRIYMQLRRSQKRRREDAMLWCFEHIGVWDDIERRIDGPRARRLLRRVIAALPSDVRAVFVMFELQQQDTDCIAAHLKLPAGTVASRLRRARRRFEQIIHGMRASGALPRAA